MKARKEKAQGGTRQGVYRPPSSRTTARPEEAPGAFPFSRGIHPEGYRKRAWTMRQYAGFGTAKDTNRRFRHLLDQGTTGLSIAFDLPTQIGLDSDHPLAQGEVGRVGVAVSCIADMEVLFEGIPLERVSVSMTINATAPILLALYLALARRRGVSWDELRGTVQNDILKEYLARGTYIHPPAPSLALTADLIAFCSTRVPQWNPISVSGYHVREAGCTAAQELAFTLSHAETYLRAAIEAGVEPAAAARRFSFFFSVDNDFLEEIAKFRAARRLWAIRLRDRFGIGDPRAQALRFHAQTAGSTLTAQQPDNNLVRVSLQALAAVLGGAQSLHTNSRDEALALPSQESATLALRTQQIIAHETGVTKVVDPLGGSWCIEALTDELTDAAGAYLDEIERRGGVLSAMDQGFQQALIDEAAYEHQRALESGETVMVGVNRFADDGFSRDWAVQRWDQGAEVSRSEWLAGWRDRRDAGPAQRVLEALREQVREGGPFMPLVIEAVDLGATLGEVSAVFREHFGEYDAFGSRI